ncbi:MAG: UbiA family prenyltransferase [Candidatus Eremiobacteraeota bacterium]|nr:UbiA family prenyltransferase [Candidatus Eremiobacteraeota bacterium]
MKTALFLREIRVEHTLFALPFAYVGALLASRGAPPAGALLWITLAVLGARTAAMAANRYLDREIDARNPRTSGRALASGALSPAAMVWAIAIGLAVLLGAAWMLNPLCVKLMPVAGVLLLFYPLCKRFTWLSHFVLGAVDALAPLGAFIGIAGTVTPAALVLFGAVTIWVAGFDVIYALMDVAVDRTQALQSLPVRFGEAAGRALPVVLHVAMLTLLALAGALAHVGPVYFLGVAAAAALIFYEERLLKLAENAFVLNQRVFAANMLFSVFFLVTTALSYVRLSR